LAGEGDGAALEEAEAVLLATTNSGARSDLQRPSMGQDMLKGRRTEIDHINGFIVREGAKAGRAAPANAALTEAVKRVERGEAPARRENVADLRPEACRDGAGPRGKQPGATAAPHLETPLPLLNSATCRPVSPFPKELRHRPRRGSVSV
jgi:hypothetical protein